MNKKSIWWRLTPVMFWLSLASVIAGIAWRECKWEPPVWMLPLILLGMYLPNLYLTAFSLWHWKYRYRGSYPVAWAALFPLFWTYLPALFYFGQHIQCDLQNKKQYAALEPLPGTVLPGYYNSLRSVFSVLGGVLVGWSAFAVALATPTFFILFNKCDQSVAQNVGKVLTGGGGTRFSRYAYNVSVICLSDVRLHGLLRSGLWPVVALQQYPLETKRAARTSNFEHARAGD